MRWDGIAYPRQKAKDKKSDRNENDGNTNSIDNFNNE
jgi:hypothetical protein